MSGGHTLSPLHRLVWSRLWHVVAQHLVSAACHTGVCRICAMPVLCPWLPLHVEFARCGAKIAQRLWRPLSRPPPPQRHADSDVAMYAVDTLRQLAAKLLDRAELTRFTSQGEALRPFAVVLRHCDAPAVRELAVACVAHAASSHPRGLGSGWRSVLEALSVAVGDEEEAVVAQALDALQVGWQGVVCGQEGRACEQCGVGGGSMGGP